MSGTHGDLFQEIGSMVLAAHEGQSIDLTAKAEELANRYDNLHVPADVIARAITRSLGAVSVSMALLRPAGAAASGPSWMAERHVADEAGPERARTLSPGKSAAALFPSGVRLAVL